MALDYIASTFGDGYDYAMVFEDDAIPHANTTWPGIDGPNHLDKRLDDLEERRGAGLFLGGSTFRGWDPSAVIGPAAAPLGGIVRAQAGYGSFAYVLSRRAVPTVVTRLRSQLKEITFPANVELDSAIWEELTKLAGQATNGGSTANTSDVMVGGGYVSTPLLVDHRKGTSLTWIDQHATIQAAYALWQGRSDWWHHSKP